MMDISPGHKLSKKGTIVLGQLIHKHGITVFGTEDEPLFMMAHVAKKINDSNYRRAALSLEKNVGYIVRKDCDKVYPTPALLTERGVYKYMIKSDRPEAESFVEWAMDIFTGVEVIADTRMQHFAMMLDKLAECAD